MTTDAFAATNQHRLHDLAKAEAERLRRLAMREFGREMVNDLWRGGDAVYQRCLETSLTLAERSATRLQAHLARRACGRVVSPSNATTSA